MNKKQAEVRERYIKKLIQEAILNVLVEQEEPQMGAAVPPPAPPVSPQMGNQPGQDQTSPPTPPGPEETAFTVDTMVDKLNVLRGGKSFKDPEVFGKLTTFFNNLTDEQKSSLEWILGELTQIVMDVGPNATEPTQPPAPPATPPAAGPSAPIQSTPIEPSGAPITPTT